MRLPFRLFCLSALALVAGCHTLRPAPASATAHRADPLLLISIDGFRADYLDRGYTPTLAMLAEHGLRSEGMQPSYPAEGASAHGRFGMVATWRTALGSSRPDRAHAW